jgi:iron complex outermembrane receptor protein
LLRYVPDTPINDGFLLVEPQTIQNSGWADTFGAELAAQWKVLDNWRLAASYSWLHVNLHPNDPYFQGNPEQQFKLRSYLDLPGNLEFNSALYYMDQQTAAAGLGVATIPSYVRLDAGLVWHPAHFLEIGVWGENLLQAEHEEFPSLKSSLQTEVPREITGKVTVKF